MSDLTKEEYKELIHECVTEVFEKHKKEAWVDPQQHYLDHQMLRICSANQEEMRKNHDFVTGMREGTDLVRKYSIITMVGMVVTAICAWVYYHITSP